MWKMKDVSVVFRQPTSDPLTISASFEAVSRGDGKDLHVHTMKLNVRPTSSQKRIWATLESLLLETAFDHIPKPRQGFHDVEEFYPENDVDIVMTPMKGEPNV